MRIWTDRRSGRLGCIAGNFVLQYLAKSHGQFTRMKGTVFESKDRIWVGRFIDENSLKPPTCHWANISLEQHRNLEITARAESKRLFYLLITASVDPHRPLIFWTLPGEIVKKAVQARIGASERVTVGIHVTVRDRRYLLEGQDISEHACLISTGWPPEQLELPEQYSGPQVRGDRKSAASRRHHPDREQVPASATDLQNYSIPLSHGRSAVLNLPIPLDGSDLSRLKGWIDLMSDLFTEGGEKDIQVRASGRDHVRSLKEQAVIGAWSDRDDITDSSDFARGLRKRAEDRSRQ